MSSQMGPVTHNLSGLLIYNRVPKCGSEVVRCIIRILKDILGYGFESSREFLDFHVSLREQVSEMFHTLKRNVRSLVLRTREVHNS